MDTRLLFPAIAITAAQTVSPSTQRAEKALRARAELFYQLELKENFRQAEAFVAEDSQDYFYNSGKPKFSDVKVGEIDFTDGNTRAVVHMNVKVERLAPGIGSQVFSGPTTADWKLEKGQRVWYFDKASTVVTPFGRMKFGNPGPGGSFMDLVNGGAAATAPLPGSLESLVSIDRQAVTLTASAPDQSVTVSNDLPGPVTLSIGKLIDGIRAELDRKEVKGGEKAVLRIWRISDYEIGRHNSSDGLSIGSRLQYSGKHRIVFQVAAPSGRDASPLRTSKINIWTEDYCSRLLP